MGRKFISSNINLFKFANNHTICAKSANEIKIINLKNDNEWYLNLDYHNKGIYSLDCDDNWLWFSNGEGLFFFKWSNYE